MRKELEAIKYLNDTCVNFLDRTKELYCTVTFTRKRAEILRDNIAEVEKALLELKSIKEANPSEALECLEKLKGMEISSMPFSDEYGTQEVDLNDIRKVGSQLNTDFREYTTTIKQALLKAQEPKQYLKWEDLKFKEEEQRLKVKMGDNFYKMEWGIDGFGANVVSLYKYITNDFLVYCACIRYNNQQFFNDLHLERVEE